MINDDYFIQDFKTQYNIYEDKGMFKTIEVENGVKTLKNIINIVFNTQNLDHILEKLTLSCDTINQQELRKLCSEILSNNLQIRNYHISLLKYCGYLITDSKIPGVNNVPWLLRSNYTKLRDEGFQNITPGNLREIDI